MLYFKYLLAFKLVYQQKFLFLCLKPSIKLIQVVSCAYFYIALLDLSLLAYGFDLITSFLIKGLEFQFSNLILLFLKAYFIHSYIHLFVSIHLYCYGGIFVEKNLFCCVMFNWMSNRLERLENLYERGLLRAVLGLCLQLCLRRYGG